MIVFDKSGSMQDDNKIANAQAGAVELLEMLAPRDQAGLVPFSSDIAVVPPVQLGKGKAELEGRIKALFPEGNTRLFEAIAVARDRLGSPPPGDRISAVVVLTDGEDNGNRMSLQQLLERLRSTGEQGDVRVFTIGYGDSARLDDLKRISKQTRAEFYVGTPQNIRAVFQEIATFF